MYKLFSISGTPLCGWTTEINLDDMDSIDDIIAEIKQRLKEWLQDVQTATNQDLYGLKRVVEDLDLHIHDLEFGDILLIEHPTIYLCQHTPCM